MKLETKIKNLYNNLEIGSIGVDAFHKTLQEYDTVIE